MHKPDLLNDCSVCKSHPGGGDHSCYWTSLWSRLQKVPRVWWKRRRDEKTDWKPSETSKVMFLEYCSHVRDVDMSPEYILTQTHVYQRDSSSMGTFGPVEF